MKLFLDTAEVQAIEKRLFSGLISGVTTNPSLIFKSGRNPDDVYKDICDLEIPDISIEVVADSASELINKGVVAHAQYGNVVTVKVPCTIEGLKACKKLSTKGIRVNVTLVFSTAQAILASLAGATYVSPFIGRLDDNSLNGLNLIGDICSLYRSQQIKTQVLAASIRDPQSVGKAFQLGADICTVPINVFDDMYKHVLTATGLEKFNQHYEAT